MARPQARPAGPRQPTAPPAARASWPAWLTPAVLAVVGLGLATWTWRTWTDPIVDFGRELYVPWRITEGDRLYRDLAYFNGPLSPYFNAGLFRVFGVSLGTLIGANLILLGAVLGLLVSLLRRAAGGLGALVGTLAFLACCAFGQNVFVANFNWVTPYSHEATHGVILGLVSLWALARWRDDGRRRWLIASGCAVGLAFLTKPEAFVAAAGASAVALVAASRRSGDPARAIGWWIGSALVPPALALLLLASGIGLGAAARGLLAAYPSALRGDIVGNPFYRRVAGLEDPAGNALRMVRYVGVGLALLAPAAAIAWLGARWPRRWAAAAALAATILVAALAVRLSLWLDAGRVLPLVLLAIAVVSLRPSLRGGSERADAALPLAVFGLLLLAKTILNSSMRHYGFALAAPGLALTAAVLAGPVPGWVDRRGGSGPALRAGALTLVAATMLSYLVGTGFFVASKPVTVAVGADRFRANDRGRVVGDALRWLEANGGPPGARRTLAVMPEGVMLNYLARLQNPTPYFKLMPVELMIFGEAAILRAYQAHPPDLVVVVHTDTREYGLGYFGVDFAQSLRQWLKANYRPVQVFGDPPLEPGSEFGIGVMERNR